MVSRARTNLLHLGWGLSALVGPFLYVMALFWALYEPASQLYLWAGVFVGVPLVLPIGPSAQWRLRTVAALVLLGTIGTVLAVVASGTSNLLLLATPPTMDVQLLGVGYDWQTNTLGIGHSQQVGRYRNWAFPERPAIALGWLTTTLGVYGRMPQRWRHQG